MTTIQDYEHSLLEDPANCIRLLKLFPLILIVSMISEVNLSTVDSKTPQSIDLYPMHGVNRTHRLPFFLEEVEV